MHQGAPPSGVAKQVAAELRRQILDGRFAAGQALPRREQLQVDFDISPPSLREAFRMLEAEGLISVKRGQGGGSFVRSLTDDHPARAIAMVLQSRHVGVRDLAEAIGLLEPLCAALCAARPDRLEVVVPALRALNAQLRDADDDQTYAQRTRLFHESIPDLCGNETVALLAGSLEALQSAHVARWMQRTTVEFGQSHDHYGRRCIDEHEALIELIANGDSGGAFRALHTHITASAEYMADVDAASSIDVDLVPPT